ncbi:hypothetical protein, partial [Pseudorhodoferax sp.]|uniref:hypothetical protein n=1 Tax=Pseudorhodoferax sp. TaxID=1993553 RepID=UPI002DD67CBA
DPAEAAERAHGFAQLLADCDAQAEEYLAEHRAALQQFLGGGALGDVERAVRNFDFDAALQTVRDAAAQQGVALKVTS